MITITSAVRSLLANDDVALEAITRGILNFSSYVKTIHSQVETICKKTVKRASIVVILARIAKEPELQVSIRPKIKIDDLTIRSPLASITYNKNQANQRRLAKLHQMLNISENTFFTTTQSINEITIVAPQTLTKKITRSFKDNPKSIFLNQVGLTVRFSKDYLSVPNVIFAIEAQLAVHMINITEIISTYTELSFIINKDQLQISTKALQELL